MDLFTSTPCGCSSVLAAESTWREQPATSQQHTRVASLPVCQEGSSLVHGLA